MRVIVANHQCVRDTNLKASTQSTIYRQLLCLVATATLEIGGCWTGFTGIIHVYLTALYHELLPDKERPPIYITLSMNNKDGGTIRAKGRPTILFGYRDKASSAGAEQTWMACMRSQHDIARLMEPLE